MRKTNRRKGKAQREATRKRRAQGRVQEERERESKRLEIAVQRAVEAHLSPEEGAFRHHRKFFASLFSLVMLLLAFYFDSFNSVWPRVSIETLDVIDPADPLSVPFRITNENFFSHYDVLYICIQVEATSSDSSKVTFQGNRYFPRDRRIGTLGPHDVATRSCRMLDMLVTGPSPIKTREFMVAVASRPWFLPDMKWARFVGKAHFVVEYDKNGGGRVVRQPQLPLPPKQPVPPLPPHTTAPPGADDVDIFD